MVETTRTAPQRLLTPREVAAALGVSVYTIRRLTKVGVLPSVKLSKRTIRYAPSVIDDLHDDQDPT